MHGNLQSEEAGTQKHRHPQEVGSILVLNTVVTSIYLISMDAFLKKGKTEPKGGKRLRIVKADGKEGRDCMRCQGSGTLTHFQSHILVELASPVANATWDRVAHKQCRLINLHR
jgi:hypothetical protein